MNTFEWVEAATRTASRALKPGFVTKAAGAVMGALLVAGFSFPAAAQIGGKTGADGVFVLEDVEDLDLTADGVQRDWVPEFIFTEPNAFAAVSPAGAGLTLASGQSPAGALKYTMPTDEGFIAYSFGVPMPSVSGASTATSPGNLTSFAALSFVTRSSLSLTNQQFLVILECYPRYASSTESNPVFPKLYWNYSVTPGNTFAPVTLDLRAPSQMDNADGYSVNQLLSQARYLAFNYYGGPQVIPTSLTVHVDDIHLEPLASASDWAMYD